MKADAYLQKLTSDELGRVLLTTLIIITITWYAFFIMKMKLKKDPPLPPGPPGIPLLGSLPFLDPELHSYFLKLSRTYGAILKLRLGKKIAIVVSSPSIAREVLKDHDVTFANRDVPDVALAGAYGGSDIVWTPYGPEWRMLRKICVREMLGNATLDSVYPLRRREIRSAINYIYSRVGLPVNIGEQMFLTVLNVITNMMWGGTVKEDERAKIGSEFRQLVAEITELLGKPNVSDFFPAIARFDLQGIKRKMAGLALRFDEIFDSIIERRLRMDSEGGSEVGKDFLQFLLQLKEEGDEKTPFTMNHLKALLMVSLYFFLLLLLLLF